MSLRDLKILPVYDSSSSSIVDDFLVPVLSSSIYYDRAVGYFTSGWLRKASVGMARFASNGGRARWITSPILSRDDWEAIVKGEIFREEEYLKEYLKKILSKQLDDIEKFLDEDTLNAISWMVADGILTFKIALPTARLERGDFHDKFGIFQDEFGNRVCFSGSYNDSIKGSFNYESIKVFTSWEPALRIFVDIDSRRFDKLWSNRDVNVRVLNVPEAIKERIISFKKERERPYKITRDFKSKKYPQVPKEIFPRDYQYQAVKKWVDNGHQGIFDMATGTGKTITALLCLLELLKSNNYLFVILTCPYIHLVDQWIAVCSNFNLETVACYESSAKWYHNLKDKLQKLSMRKHLQLDGHGVLVAAVSNASFTSDKFQSLLKEVDIPIFFLADEVHRLGSYINLSLLPEKATFRLGLSATPDRWYDPGGTEALNNFFKGIVFSLDLGEAIYKYDVLSRYIYKLQPVELRKTELEQYRTISLRIAKILGDKKTQALDVDDGVLGNLLRERANILNNAAEKIPLLEKLLLGQKEIDYTLIYTSPEQITAVNEMLANINIVSHQITYRETGSERGKIIKAFEEGLYKVLTAIRCLDEGVDVPGIKTAYILASTGNPREFIQRRGRILRKSEGKEISTIIDFITLPATDLNQFKEENLWVEKAILKREFFRLHYFAKWAENKHEAILSVYDLASQFGVQDALIGGHGEN